MLGPSVVYTQRANMHLAVDAMGIKHSGGATVLLDFLQVALSDPRVARVSVFCSPRSKRRFVLPESSKVRVYEQPLAEDFYLYRMIWFAFILGRRCNQVGAEVLLCLAGAGRTPSGPRHVTFIQQSLPFASEFTRFATLAERARMMILKQLMRSSCRSADRVIVQTPTMKSWVTDQFVLPAEQVSVVIPAVTPLPTPGSSARRLLRDDDSPKLLYVGGDSAYKNVQTVIHGLSVLRSSVPDATLYLTWPTDHAAASNPGVVCLGYLSRERLAEAYHEATLLVMPSLVETVGLPILEAMHAGLPVLAADRPYARDIAEDAADFFDPHSPQDFAEKARQSLQDVEHRQALIEKGRLLVAKREATHPYQQLLDLVLARA